MNTANHHRDLQTKTWSSAEYYQKAAHGSLVNHPAFSSVLPLTQNQTVLEVGCGEGSKLKVLKPSMAIGIDVSLSAAQLAQQKGIWALVAKGERLPFKSNSFQTVVSFFVIEHVQNPELVISEMARVVKPGGYLGLVAPNYGAPNRASPCYQGNRLGKLAQGFLVDFLIRSPRKLHWHPVTPRSLSEAYQMDFDTTVEPYQTTLINYLQSLGFAITDTNTFWELPMENEPAHQKLFKWFGMRKIYPFRHWGPHLMVIGQKRQL